MEEALSMNTPSLSSEQEEAIPTRQTFLVLPHAFLRVKEGVIHLLELGHQSDKGDNNCFIIQLRTNIQ